MTLTRVILEGEITDSFPLEGAKSGKLNLHLRWMPQPIYRDSWVQSIRFDSFSLNLYLEGFFARYPWISSCRSSSSRSGSTPAANGCILVSIYMVVMYDLQKYGLSLFSKLVISINDECKSRCTCGAHKMDGGDSFASVWNTEFNGPSV